MRTRRGRAQARIRRRPRIDAPKPYRVPLVAGEGLESFAATAAANWLSLAKARTPRFLLVTRRGLVSPAVARCGAIGGVDGRLRNRPFDRDSSTVQPDRALDLPQDLPFARRCNASSWLFGTAADKPRSRPRRTTRRNSRQQATVKRVRTRRICLRDAAQVDSIEVGPTVRRIAYG